MEVRVLLPQPLFGSQALTVKPPALTRQNSEHLARATLGPLAPTCWLAAPLRCAEAAHQLARWRSSQRSSLIRRRPRVRIPLEPPIFSKCGRAANAARCKRDALSGYEGAS